MKDVCVLGVGMHRFGMFPDSSNAEMSRIAGLAALKDAGLSFKDVNAAYVGQTSITTLGTIGTGTWRGTPVEVASGGTGATTPAAARVNLGAATGLPFTVEEHHGGWLVIDIPR